MLNLKKYIPLIFTDILAACSVVYTAWLGNHGSWTAMNLSVLGYWYGLKSQLVAWGWLTGITFAGFMAYLMRLYRFRDLLCAAFTALAAALLISGVYLPYLPGQHPVLSNIHIAASFMSPLCLVAALIRLILAKRKVKEKRAAMNVYLAIMAVLMIGAAVIFVKCSIITTLLEVYTVLALTLVMTALAVSRLRDK